MTALTGKDRRAAGPSAPLRAALGGRAGAQRSSRRPCRTGLPIAGLGRGDLQGELRGEIQGRLPPGDQEPQERLQHHHEHHVDRRRPHDGRLRGVSGFRCRKRRALGLLFRLQHRRGHRELLRRLRRGDAAMHLVVGAAQARLHRRGVRFRQDVLGGPPTSRSR